MKNRDKRDKTLSGILASTVISEFFLSFVNFLSDNLSLITNKCCLVFSFQVCKEETAAGSLQVPLTSVVQQAVNYTGV